MPTKKLSKSAKFTNNQKRIYTISTIHLRDKSQPLLERKYSVFSNDMGYLLYKIIQEHKWDKIGRKGQKKVVKFVFRGRWEEGGDAHWASMHIFRFSMIWAVHHGINFDLITLEVK